MTVSGVPRRAHMVAEGKAFPCLSASNQTALPRAGVGGRFLSVKKCSKGVRGSWFGIHQRIPPAFPGRTEIQGQGGPLTRWNAIYLVGYLQSSHSPLWASHHAGKSGSFGERVGLIGTYNAVPPTSALKSVNSFIGFEIPK